VAEVTAAATVVEEMVEEAKAAARAAVVRAAVVMEAEMVAVEMGVATAGSLRLHQRSTARQTSRNSRDSCRFARCCPKPLRAARQPAHARTPPTSTRAGHRGHSQ
jgi:hypothetical protein